MKPVAFSIKLSHATHASRCLRRGNKKPLLIEEKRLKHLCLFSSFPEQRRALADVQAGFGTCHNERLRYRLPWFHRASPSTTLNEIRYINEYG